jgi:hypothetical protein
VIMGHPASRWLPLWTRGLRRCLGLGPAEPGLRGGGLNIEQVIERVTLVVVELTANLRGIQPRLALRLRHRDRLVEGVCDGVLAILGQTSELAHRVAHLLALARLQSFHRFSVLNHLVPLRRRHVIELREPLMQLLLLLRRKVAEVRLVRQRTLLVCQGHVAMSLHPSSQMLLGLAGTVGNDQLAVRRGRLGAHRRYTPGRTRLRLRSFRLRKGSRLRFRLGALDGGRLVRLRLRLCRLRLGPRRLCLRPHVGVRRRTIVLDALLRLTLAIALHWMEPPRRLRDRGAEGERGQEQRHDLQFRGKAKRPAGPGVPSCAVAAHGVQCCKGNLFGPNRRVLPKLGCRRSSRSRILGLCAAVLILLQRVHLLESLLIAIQNLQIVDGRGGLHRLMNRDEEAATAGD